MREYIDEIIEAVQQGNLQLAREIFDMAFKDAQEQGRRKVERDAKWNAAKEEMAAHAEIERLRAELDSERSGKTYRSECAGCLAVMPELERLRAAIRAAIDAALPAHSETKPECPDCDSTDLIRIQAVHPDIKILVPVSRCNRCGVEVAGGDAEDVIDAHLMEE